MRARRRDRTRSSGSNGATNDSPRNRAGGSGSSNSGSSNSGSGNSGSGNSGSAKSGGQRSRRRAGGGGGGGASGGGGGPAGSGGGNKRRGANQRGRRRGRGRPRQPQGPGFWGDAGALPTDQPDIMITDAPAAVPHSLGRPPLPGHETIAEHYFGAVYERAVSTASALAAAGGLLDPATLLDTDQDD